MRRFRNPIQRISAVVVGCAFCSAVCLAADSPLPLLVLIKPGTEVGKTAPTGWSNLVIKSLPKVESGDVDTLPSIGLATASLFRTVMLADVRPIGATRDRHVLRRVGLGLCVPVKGTDTVVTEENASTPPISLGFVEGQVLIRAEEELKKARIIGRTQTCAVLASPSELTVGKSHKRIYLIYALLVDPPTGRLDTYLWAISIQADRRTTPASLARLSPGLVIDCGLDVSADRLLGSLPYNWSFAMRALPPGEPIVTPQALRPWLTDLDKIAAGPAEFERLMRSEVPPGKERSRPDASKSSRDVR